MTGSRSAATSFAARRIESLCRAARLDALFSLTKVDNTEGTAVQMYMTSDGGGMPAGDAYIVVVAVHGMPNRVFADAEPGAHVDLGRHRAGPGHSTDQYVPP